MPPDRQGCSYCIDCMCSTTLLRANVCVLCPCRMHKWVEGSDISNATGTAYPHTSHCLVSTHHTPCCSCGGGGSGSIIAAAVTKHACHMPTL